MCSFCPRHSPCLSSRRRERGHFLDSAEGSTLMSMKSFVNDEKGYETIELMEDSVLYMLERGTALPFV